MPLHLLKSGLFPLLAVLLLGTLSSCSPQQARYQFSGPTQAPHVILLHGLARSDSSMNKLARSLANEGLGVCNVGYPSTSMTVPEINQHIISEAIQRCENRGATQIHFVGHSMGAILARYTLAKSPPQKSGKLVQLAPPNQGSEIVDKLGDWPLFFRVNGPGGVSLGTGSNSVVKQLGAVQHPTLVIAGTLSINPFLSLLLPGRDDGKVTVENTKVAGMDQHITVRATHPLIMKRKCVIDKVVNYLSVGSK